MRSALGQSLNVAPPASSALGSVDCATASPNLRNASDGDRRGASKKT